LQVSLPGGLPVSAVKNTAAVVLVLEPDFLDAQIQRIEAILVTG
jgi:hypothetical protein